LGEELWKYEELEAAVDVYLQYQLLVDASQCVMHPINSN
jgi:hypothetical protein